MKRDDFLHQHLVGSRGLTWLDVGAGDGHVTDQLEALHIGRGTCIDLFDKGRVSKYNGLCLDYADKSFDFVLFNFVLHHAAEVAEPLLIKALRIAKTQVVIQEDLYSSEESIRSAQIDHDPKAIYHTRAGWMKLFEKIGAEVLVFREFPEYLVDDHIYQTPRALMALKN